MDYAEFSCRWTDKKEIWRVVDDVREKYWPEATDDLYQSGVSINYVAMLMLEAGAKDVFGLVCEKTCRNDDNVARSSIK